MIAHLKGMVIDLTSDGVILDVRGVGYWVDCPLSFLQTVSVDQEIELYTHQYIREDEISLFGFEAFEQLNLFRQLLKISGIGPRLAIGIIDRGTPDEIVKAIGTEDISFFTAVSGVGKKGAARIVLELKSKLTDIAISGIPKGPEDDEVVQALTSLGFAKKEVTPVLGELDSSAPIEERVKLALKKLSSGS